MSAGENRESGTTIAIEPQDDGVGTNLPATGSSVNRRVVTGLGILGGAAAVGGAVLACADGSLIPHPDNSGNTTNPATCTNTFKLDTAGNILGSLQENGVCREVTVTAENGNFYKDIDAALHMNEAQLQKLLVQTWNNQRGVQKPRADESTITAGSDEKYTRNRAVLLSPTVATIKYIDSSDPNTPHESTRVFVPTLYTVVGKDGKLEPMILMSMFTPGDRISLGMNWEPYANQLGMSNSGAGGDSSVHIGVDVVEFAKAVTKAGGHFDPKHITSFAYDKDGPFKWTLGPGSLIDAAPMSSDSFTATQDFLSSVSSTVSKDSSGLYRGNAQDPEGQYGEVARNQSDDNPPPFIFFKGAKETDLARSLFLMSQSIYGQSSPIRIIDDHESTIDAANTTVTLFPDAFSKTIQVKDYKPVDIFLNGVRIRAYPAV